MNEAQFLPIKKLLERRKASEVSQRLKCLFWAPTGTRYRDSKFSFNKKIPIKANF